MNGDDNYMEKDNSSNRENQEEIRLPEAVPEEQTGMTEEEREWSTKAPPRPSVPRYVFITAAIILLAAFAGGSWWYYRTNVLPEKYYMKATALYEQRQYARAEELYRRIMKLRPERRDVLFYIASCREEQGDKDGAIKYYMEHLKSAVNDARAMTRLGWLNMEKGDYGQALKWFKEAGKRKKKDTEVWSLTAMAALKAGEKPDAAEAYSRIAELSEEPEKVMDCGKSLMKIGAWQNALEVYTRAAKLVSGDAAPLHGINAAKVMLGYPTDAKYTVLPGKALGFIELDASKEQVKEALGGRSPDGKEFSTVGGKSLLAARPVEIWTYNPGDMQHEIRVIFAKDKVVEIETPSTLYKTEEGLGLSNYMLAKNADKLKWRKEARNSSVLCLAKHGGLTFYGYLTTPDGTDFSFKRLRVHHGDISLDNLDEFPLMRLQ